MKSRQNIPVKSRNWNAVDKFNADISIGSVGMKTPEARPETEPHIFTRSFLGTVPRLTAVNFRHFSHGGVSRWIDRWRRFTMDR